MGELGGTVEYLYCRRGAGPPPEGVYRQAARAERGRA